MFYGPKWQIISNDAVWMFPPDIQLSTVKLPNAGFYDDSPYESCLFYANGDSEVVARYATQEEAILGHNELEKKYSLQRTIKFHHKKDR